MRSEEDWMAPNNFRGWLLDLYPSNPGEITLWFITENGKRVKVVDEFKPKIYVAGDIEDLERLPDRLVGSKSVSRLRFVEKYVSIMDIEKSKVLEIEVTDCRRIPFFARKVVRLGTYGKFRLYNVDVPPSQAYLYEKDIFPLAFMEVSQSNGKCDFRLLDSVESKDYELPPPRILWLDVFVEGSKKLIGFYDRIERFELKSDGEKIVIDGSSERDRLLELVKRIKDIDPDIIFNEWWGFLPFSILGQKSAHK